MLTATDRNRATSPDPLVDALTAAMEHAEGPVLDVLRALASDKADRFESAAMPTTAVQSGNAGRRRSRALTAAK